MSTHLACAISIDIGTTNWKAAAFTLTGELLTVHRHKTITHYDKMGGGYYDSLEVWETIAQLIKKVLADLAGQYYVLGVSVASIGESVVPIDYKGNPLDQIIAWFSITNEAEETLDKNAEMIYCITGLDPNPVFSASKIVGLLKSNPRLISKVYKWLPMADYINLCLTGEFATDYSLASRTHLFDIRRNEWSQELANLFGIPIETLPKVVPSGSLLGPVNKQAAEKTNLTPGTKVYVGGHDHYCGYLASGCLKDFTTLDSSGTAESLVTVLPDGTFPETFTGNRVGRFLDPKYLATIAGIISAGLSVDWGFRRFCNQFEDAPINYDVCVNLIKPGRKEHGKPLFLPHLRGAGGPIWDPYSRGAFVGLNPRHNNSDLVSSIIEGLCFEVKRMVKSREDTFGITIPGLTTIGGGAKNIPWQEIKATILQKPIILPEIGEASLQGAALIALAGDAGISDLSAISAEYDSGRSAVIEPNKKYINFYDELSEIYEAMYDSTKLLSSKLVRFYEKQRKNLI